MHAPFGGLCLARPHSLSLSLSPDYALLERLFERASPAHAPLELPVRARDPRLRPARTPVRACARPRLRLRLAPYRRTPCGRCRVAASPVLRNITSTPLPRSQGRRADATPVSRWRGELVTRLSDASEPLTGFVHLVAFVRCIVTPVRRPTSRYPPRADRSSPWIPKKSYRSRHTSELTPARTLDPAPSASPSIYTRGPNAPVNRRYPR